MYHVPQDERTRAKRLGKEKFDLNQEHEKLSEQLRTQADGYENQPMPGPRKEGRTPAD